LERTKSSEAAKIKACLTGLLQEQHKTNRMRVGLPVPGKMLATSYATDTTVSIREISRNTGIRLSLVP